MNVKRNGRRAFTCRRQLPALFRTLDWRLKMRLSSCGRLDALAAVDCPLGREVDMQETILEILLAISAILNSRE